MSKRTNVFRNPTADEGIDTTVRKSHYKWAKELAHDAARIAGVDFLQFPDDSIPERAHRLGLSETSLRQGLARFHQLSVEAGYFEKHVPSYPE